eukprot:10797621-Alexandrium_andersonii.AAC.1
MKNLSHQTVVRAEIITANALVLDAREFEKEATPVCVCSAQARVVVGDGGVVSQVAIADGFKKFVDK